MSTAPPPELPIIEDFNLLLEVVTHKDLRPSDSNEPHEWGDNERLAELGVNVLNNVVTLHFFSKRPLIRGEEIRTWRDHYTSAETLNNWLDLYNLKQKLRVPPNLRDTILNDQQQMATYFHSYVGAVFLTKGLTPLQRWISRLIEPGSQPNQLPNTQNDHSSAGGHASTSGSDPFSSSPPAALTIPVSLVNQVALQRGVPINYVSFQEGLSHQPTWTVRCYIDNVERGAGVAKTLKVAKEDAARQAWVTMGW